MSGFFCLKQRHSLNFAGGVFRMLSRDFSSILNCPMHFLHLVSFESIYASKVYVITVPGDSFPGTGLHGGGIWCLCRSSSGSGTVLDWRHAVKLKTHHFGIKRFGDPLSRATRCFQEGLLGNRMVDWWLQTVLPAPGCGSGAATAVLLAAAWVFLEAFPCSGDWGGICACCSYCSKYGPCLCEARVAVTMPSHRSSPGFYLHYGVMKLDRMCREDIGRSLRSSAVPSLGYSLFPLLNLASDTSVTTISNFFLVVNATCFFLSIWSVLRGGGFLGHVCLTGLRLSQLQPWEYFQSFLVHRCDGLFALAFRLAQYFCADFLFFFFFSWEVNVCFSKLESNITEPKGWCFTGL